MHSDPALVERLLGLLPATLEPREMFGGRCWMLGGHMCVGVYKTDLITRIGVEAFNGIAGIDGVEPMNITGKVMKGWARIGPRAIASEVDLKRHVGLAIDFVATLPPK